MAQDLLEQLAEAKVPPVPDQFDQRVHLRLNKMLLWTHLTDLYVRGFVYAVGHFARAFVGLVMFTLSGRFEEPHHRRR